MWTIFQEELPEDNLIKYKILENDEPISFKKWIQLIKESSEFILFFNELLQTSEYEAFFWEVKPVTKSSIEDEFEFVLVGSKFLAKIEADDSYFKKYFEKGEKVVSFPNLGGDAQLIVPTQLGEASWYSHIAKFVRNAPQEQILKLWQRVGQEYEKLIGEKPKWLSTSGLGVYWLHVRIDSRPKYYHCPFYKK